MDKLNLLKKFRVVFVVSRVFFMFLGELEELIINRKLKRFVITLKREELGFSFLFQLVQKPFYGQCLFGV